jgi:DNA-binding transcriptional MocR family regulator
MTEYEQGHHPPGLINLRLGHPSARLLPIEAFRRAAAHRLTDADRTILQYGADLGYGSYLTALAAFLSGQLAPLRVEARELMGTCGNSLGLKLVCDTLRTARAPHRPLVALVEQPTYYIAGQIFASAGVECVAVLTDGEGLRPELLADAVERCVATHGVPPAMLYTIPRYHNPLGVSLTRARGEAVVAFAASHRMLVVADEPYSLLRFPDAAGAAARAAARGAPRDAPLASLMELDRGRGVVVALGSYSKILAPGMRCGWLHAAPARIAEFGQHGVVRSGGGLNPVVFGIAHSILVLGFLDGHLASLRRTLAARRDALVDALRSLLPDVALPHADAPAGGYFLWAVLPPRVTDAAALLAFCDDVGAGVAFTPGAACVAAPVEGGAAARAALRRSVRFSFAFYEEAELREGVVRLASALALYAAPRRSPRAAAL